MVLTDTALVSFHSNIRNLFDLISYD